MNEYVDLLLTVENGQIVDCSFHGEGIQVEPLTKPIILIPAGGHQNFERLEKQIQRALLL